MTKASATTDAKRKAKRAILKRRNAAKLGTVAVTSKSGRSAKSGRFVAVHKSSLGKPVTKPANITSADAEKAVRTYLLELTH